ncbi:SDR family NAD(P)-dependent oxidoreductase [Vibrio vulnificus]|nr:SDR family NAD(P)-dependent oxidoreductase [Vibrio vulnificus]
MPAFSVASVRLIIITGASSGIGEATAKLLASKGAKVILGARREDKLIALTEEIQKAGGQAAYRVTDFVNPDDSQQLVQQAKDTFGGVDVIFLNAGILPNSPLSELKTNEWNSMVDVNFKGVLNGIAAVLPTFTSQKSGQIVIAGMIAFILGIGLSVCPRFRDFLHHNPCNREVDYTKLKSIATS